jgi:putrescine transport system ATP-binding protein
MRKPLGPVRSAFQPWAEASARPLVEFRAVTRRFGDVTAVDRLSLALYPGEFFALLGPSGCGKSTLMRMLAGFETPDDGDILLDGESILGTPPHRRPVNMMFQSYALFPHMNVEANIAYGLKQEGLPRADIASRVDEVLALVRMNEFRRRMPAALSGGQMQRVALARALAKRPRVLLLDEPLGALDRKLREATQYELMDVQEKLGTTFLMVTHDQDEAMAMAHRIGVMNGGRIAQLGTPVDIYEAPRTAWVAGFVGDVTIMAGRVSAIAGDQVTIESAAFGTLVIDEAEALPVLGDAVDVAIRPEKISLRHADEAIARPANAVAGTILDIGYLGDMTMVEVRIGGGDGPVMRVGLTNRARRVERPFSWGDVVQLSWDIEAGVLLRVG